MTSFLHSRADFLLFISGFLLILSAFESLLIYKEEKSSREENGRRVWLFLFGFLLIQGIHPLWIVSNFALAVQRPLDLVQAAFDVVSFTWFFSFACAGFTRPSSRKTNILIVLVVVPASVVAYALFSAKGVILMAKGALGIPSAFIAAIASLKGLKTRSKENRLFLPLLHSIGFAIFTALLIIETLDEVFFSRRFIVVTLSARCIFSLVLVTALSLQEWNLFSKGSGGILSASAHFVLGRSYFLWIVLLAGGWGFTSFLGDSAVEEVTATSFSQVSTLASLIEAQTTQTDHVARLLANSPTVARFFDSETPSARKDVESVIKSYEQAFPWSVCALVDLQGIVRLSSDRLMADSIAEKDVSQQPYFRDARSGGEGHYFRTKISSSTRGYFASFPVHSREGKLTGVVILMQETNDFQNTIRGMGDSYLVDENGEIFISSEKELVSRPLWPSKKTNGSPAYSGPRLGFHAFSLPLLDRQPLHGQPMLYENAPCLVTRISIPPRGWSIIHFTPLKIVFIYKAVGVIATFILLMIVAGVIMIGKLLLLSSVRITQSEARYRTLVQSLPSWISIVGENGIVHFLNPQGIRAIDMKEEEIIGKSCQDILGVEQGQRLMRIISENNDTEKQVSFEFSHSSRAGQARTWSFISVPLTLLGMEKCFMLIGTDITEKKAAEERLLR